MSLDINLKENIAMANEDLVNLIKYKKSNEEQRKNMVCNQLCFLTDYEFQTFWWKFASEELQWEFQYEWQDNAYMRNGVHKEKIKRTIKFLFSKEKVESYNVIDKDIIDGRRRYLVIKYWKITIKNIIYYLIQWATWDLIVQINYLNYVKIPFIIRRIIGEKVIHKQE